MTRGTASTLYVGKPSPKSSADQKLTVTEMFHKSSIEDFVPLVSTAKRDKPLEWRPFWPSREHPLLLALGQQSETRLWARGLPTYFCLLRMLKPRTGSPTVVGFMWAGCRGIHSSSLWRQRDTFGKGRTTTPSRAHVFVVLFYRACHDLVRSSVPKKESSALSHMSPRPKLGRTRLSRNSFRNKVVFTIFRFAKFRAKLG